MRFVSFRRHSAGRRPWSGSCKRATYWHSTPSALLVLLTWHSTPSALLVLLTDGCPSLTRTQMHVVCKHVLDWWDWAGEEADHENEVRTIRRRTIITPCPGSAAYEPEPDSTSLNDACRSTLSLLPQEPCSHLRTALRVSMLCVCASWPIIACRLTDMLVDVCALRPPFRVPCSSNAAEAMALGAAALAAGSHRAPRHALGRGGERIM